MSKSIVDMIAGKIPIPHLSPNACFEEPSAQYPPRGQLFT